MGVLMSHTQDVKCVAWHPTEEVVITVLFPALEHKTDALTAGLNFSISRFSHPGLTMTRSDYTSTILQMIGTISRH